MEGTLNDRAGGDLHVNTSNMEERKMGDIIDVSFTLYLHATVYSELSICCSRLHSLKQIDSLGSESCLALLILLKFTWHRNWTCCLCLQSENWIEVRLQGKLPERRSNHASFILTLRNDE